MTTPKLQHELKKKRPFESPEEEAALNIVRTSDQLQIRFARLLREYVSVSVREGARVSGGAGQGETGRVPSVAQFRCWLRTGKVTEARSGGRNKKLSRSRADTLLRDSSLGSNTSRGLAVLSQIRRRSSRGEGPTAPLSAEGL